MEPDDTLRNLKDRTELLGGKSLTQQVFEAAQPRGMPEVMKGYSGSIAGVHENIKHSIADQDRLRVAALQRIRESMQPPLNDARERLLQALDTSSAAHLNLKGSLDGVPPMPDFYREPPSVPAFTTYEPPPNPIYETNRKLVDLKAEIVALVEVAREQAKLTQAINESTQAALQLASQSSEEAKASSELARTSIELTEQSLALSKQSLIVADQGVTFARQSVKFAKLALLITIVSSILSAFISLYIDYRNRTTSRTPFVAAHPVPKKQDAEKTPTKPKP